MISGAEITAKAHEMLPLKPADFQILLVLLDGDRHGYGIMKEVERTSDGTVRLELFKGAVQVVGRKSDDSLYSQAHVTFEADQVYDQSDAEGFIKLNALRLRLAKMRDR